MIGLGGMKFMVGNRGCPDGGAISRSRDLGAPNALPMPGVTKGLLELDKTIELSSDFHFSDGDQSCSKSFGTVLLPLFRANIKRYN